MSIDQLPQPTPVASDPHLPHRRRLLALLASREKLTQVLQQTEHELSPEDRLETTRVLALVEDELEHHFPHVFARHLPHWILQESKTLPHPVPDCLICRGDTLQAPVARE